MKRGIVVPDDFVLPEGYVRHYQTTDDGQQLPPILMFHPDYEFVDEQRRRRSRCPSDRVVPPELAPPGLPDPDARAARDARRPCRSNGRAPSASRPLAARSPASLGERARVRALRARRRGRGSRSAGSGSCRGSRRSTGRASLRGALGAGLVMSVAFTLAVFGWFASAIATYTGAPLGRARWCSSLARAALPAAVRRLRGRAPRWRGVAAASGAPRSPALASTSATEWACPKLFADTLGHGLYASAWMRQAADLGGAPGLTFVLVLANECVLAACARAAPAARAAPRRSRRRSALLRRARSLALRRGALRAARGARRGAASRAALVQADISHYDRLAAELGTFEAVRRILDAHFALSREAARARRRSTCCVWPETVYPTTFGAPKSEDGAAFDREIAGVRRAAPACRSSSAPTTSTDGDEFNAAVFLEPRGDGRARVRHLSQGDALPADRARAGAARLACGPRRAARGSARGSRAPGRRSCRSAARRARASASRRSSATTPSIRASRSTPCAHGAELIVTLSNDSWFATGAGPRLHLVGRGVSQHRDAPPAAARHQHRHLGGDRADGRAARTTSAVGTDDAHRQVVPEDRRRR